MSQRKLTSAVLPNVHTPRSLSHDSKASRRRPKTVIHASLKPSRHNSQVRPSSTRSTERSVHSYTVTRISRQRRPPATTSDVFGNSACIPDRQTNDSDSYKSCSSKNTRAEAKSRLVIASEAVPCQTKKNDRHTVVMDHHREPSNKKKPKCSRRCIFALVLASMLAIVISVIAVLLSLLIKPSSTARRERTDVPVLRWNTTGVTVAGVTGSFGNTSSELNTPVDVVLDHANNLYVADYLNYRIQKYPFGVHTGTTVAGNGSVGTSASQLDKALRMIVDTSGNLYVSDSNNHRVQFWGNGAQAGITVAGTSNTPGNASNQFNIVYGIARHPTSGALYLADYYNHRIMLYPSGPNSGTLVFGGNGSGTTNTQLFRPVGLHLDIHSNSLIIANFGAHNIVQYTFGASTWNLLAGNPSGLSGATSADLNGPMEAIFDPMGNMYVADRNNQRIQLFYKGQTNGITIAGISGVSGNNATTLNWPRSVRLDSQLNLYVADSNNHRIQKFSRY